MDFEPKIEQPIEAKIDAPDSSKSDSKNSRFNVILIFVSIILVGAALVSAYFLFFSSRESSSNKITDLIEPLSSQLSLVEENNVNLIKNNKQFVATIYYQSLDSKTSEPITFIGSGVFIGSEGYLVTSKNVIKDLNPNFYKVIVQKEIIENKVIQKFYEDKNSNLILIKLADSSNSFKALTDLPNNFNEGREVISIYSQTETTEPVIKTSKGMVSYFDTTTQNYFSDISQRNLGGVIVDNENNFVGLGDGMDSNNNLKIISVKNIKNFYDEVMNSSMQGEKVDLGIEFKFENLKNYMTVGKPVGNVIYVVKEASLASTAGLKTGDVILSINNQEFSSEAELREFLSKEFVENELKIEIFRDKQKLGITLNLK